MIIRNDNTEESLLASADCKIGGGGIIRGAIVQTSPIPANALLAADGITPLLAADGTTILIQA